MVARMTVNNLPNLVPRALIGSGRGDVWGSLSIKTPLVQSVKSPVGLGQ